MKRTLRASQLDDINVRHGNEMDGLLSQISDLRESKSELEQKLVNLQSTADYAESQRLDAEALLVELKTDTENLQDGLRANLAEVQEDLANTDAKFKDVSTELETLQARFASVEGHRDLLEENVAKSSFGDGMSSRHCSGPH